jgi:hypothetical protein
LISFSRPDKGDDVAIKCPKCHSNNPDTQKFCGECTTFLKSSENITFSEILETPRKDLTAGIVNTLRRKNHA